MGSLRSDFYRNRGRAHALCSARSCVVELAAHRLTWHFSGTRGRITILAHRDGAIGAGLHVVPGADPPRRSCRDLVRCLCNRCDDLVRGLLFSAERILAGSSPRRLAGNHLADARHGRSVSRDGATTRPKLSRVAGRSSGRAGRLRRFGRAPAISATARHC